MRSAGARRLANSYTMVRMSARFSSGTGAPVERTFFAGTRDERGPLSFVALKLPS